MNRVDFLKALRPKRLAPPTSAELARKRRETIERYRPRMMGNCLHLPSQDYLDSPEAMRKLREFRRAR